MEIASRPYSLRRSYTETTILTIRRTASVVASTESLLNTFCAIRSVSLCEGRLTLAHSIRQSGLVQVPSHLSYVEASTLPIAAVTAWHSLFAHPGAVLLPGQTVLVLGTGGVSIFAAQLATLCGGAKVIATSSSDEKLARVAAALGVGYLGGVNYRNVKDWDKEVVRIDRKSVV